MSTRTHPRERGRESTHERGKGEGTRSNANSSGCEKDCLGSKFLGHIPRRRWRACECVHTQRETDSTQIFLYVRIYAVCVRLKNVNNRAAIGNCSNLNMRALPMQFGQLITSRGGLWCSFTRKRSRSATARCAVVRSWHTAALLFAFLVDPYPASPIETSFVRVYRT